MTPPAAASITAPLAALHDDGFVLLPGALDPAAVAWARDALIHLTPQGLDYQGLVDDHYKCVFNRDPRWLDYIDRPGVIELMAAALGEDCHLVGETAWRCRPGFIGGDLHLDYLVMELPPALLADPAFQMPMQVCTVHFYLDDIDADLCPTLVLPGSHRAGRAPRAGETSWDGRALELVLCHAGDALVFRSELWHAGSRNRTADRSRHLLQVHYGRRMVAQKFSPYLEFWLAPTTLVAATPRQRRLLGEHAPAEYD